MEENKIEEELKPCPFCGGEAKFYQNIEENNCFIECTKCQASSPLMYHYGDDAKPHVIEAWNSRQEQHHPPLHLEGGGMEGKDNKQYIPYQIHHNLNVEKEMLEKQHPKASLEIEEMLITAYEKGTKDGRFHTSYESDEVFVRRNAKKFVKSILAQQPKASKADAGIRWVKLEDRIPIEMKCGEEKNKHD